MTDFESPEHALSVGFLTPEYYGASGLGVVDDSAAVLAFFRKMEELNKPGYAFGKYNLQSPIALPDYKSDFDLSCSGHSSFLAGEYAAPAVQVKGDESKKRKFRLVGGQFDTTNSIFNPGVGSGTGLSITRFWSGVLRDAVFVCNRPWPQFANGDSGTTGVDVFNILVTGCRFAGNPDAGLYWGGNDSLLSGDNGGECVFTGNFFHQNSVGLTLKRQFQRCIITGNIFSESRSGISIVYAGVTPPGGDMIIADNLLNKVGKRPIRVQSTGRSSQISGNRVLDWGYEEDQETFFGPGAAIMLQGGVNHLVTNNHFEMDALAKTADHVGVRLSTFDWDGQTHFAGRTTVSGNTGINLAALVREDVGAGYAHGGENTLIGCDQPARFDHAKSWIGFKDNVDPQRSKVFGAADFGYEINGVLQ